MNDASMGAIGYALSSSAVRVSNACTHRWSFGVRPAFTTIFCDCFRLLGGLEDERIRELRARSLRRGEAPRTNLVLDAVDDLVVVQGVGLGLDRRDLADRRDLEPQDQLAADARVSLEASFVTRLDAAQATANLLRDRARVEGRV